MPVVSVLERLWYYLSFTQLSLWHHILYSRKLCFVPNEILAEKGTRMLKGRISLDEISETVTSAPFKAIDSLVEAIARTDHTGSSPHTPELLTLFSQAVLISQMSMNPSGEMTHAPGFSSNNSVFRLGIS